MAYIPKEDGSEQSGMNVLAQEEQSDALSQEENNLSANASAAPTSSTSTLGSSQKAPTSGQSNSQSAGGSGSGTFTNLAKYRQANQPAAQGIADAVTKSSENKAGEIGQAVQAQKSQFQSQVDANRARMEAASNFATGQIEQAGQEVPEQDTERFQSIMNQPNQFNQATANFVPQEQDLTQMANTAQNANRQDARMQLLKQTFGGQDAYTSGQQNLDDLIVSGDESARTQIAQAPQQAVQGLQDQIQQAKDYASAQKSALGQEEVAMREGIQTGVDDAQQALIDRLQGKVDTASAELGSIPAMQEAFQTGNFTPELLEELGLADNRMYGVDPLEYLKGAATIGNVATQEDLARAQALAGLEGSQQDIFLDPNEIGTYKDTETASLDQLRDQVAMQKRAYEGELSPLTGNKTEFQNLQDAYREMAARNEARTSTMSQEDLASFRPETMWRNDDYRNRIIGLGLSENDLIGLRPGQHAGTSLEDRMSQNKERYYSGVDSDIRDLQSNYGYNNVLSAEEGGVKESPRLASIKKLLGY